MIQFNLLPDVKMQYLKVQKSKQIVTSVSILCAVVALALLLLLLVVVTLQKKHLNDLSKDIRTESSQLDNQSNLNRILTVQNQLGSLTQLHNQKPAAARLSVYLSQVVPNQVNANNLTVDYGQHTVTVTGTADSLSTINKFADTLKFTNYSTSGDKSTSPAFNNVVLSGFGLSDKTATYTITFNYDPAIFDITKNVVLSVPNLVTTRSEVDKPTDLFAPVNTKAGQ